MKAHLLASTSILLAIAASVFAQSPDKSSSFTAVLYKFWDTDHLVGVAQREGPVNQEGMILTYLPGEEMPLVENDLSLSHSDIPAGQPFFWRALSNTFPETGCIAGLSAGQMRLQGLGGWQDYPHIVVPRSSEGIELKPIGEVNETWQERYPRAFGISIEPWIGERLSEPGLSGFTPWVPDMTQRSFTVTVEYLPGNALDATPNLNRVLPSIITVSLRDGLIEVLWGDNTIEGSQFPFVIVGGIDVPAGPLQVTAHIEGYTTDSLFIPNAQNFESYSWKPLLIPDLDNLPGPGPLNLSIANLPESWPSESVQPGLLDILLCTCASETLLRAAADANTDTVHDVADYIRLEVNV
ncbi:MAG: hypothetical protein RLY93_18375 [Sumerlaeia bacterium]